MASPGPLPIVVAATAASPAHIKDGLPAAEAPCNVALAEVAPKGVDYIGW